MAWKVSLTPDAQKDLKKLDHQTAQRILKFLFGRVAALENPRSIGEALRGPRLGEFWRYRVGDYRLLCSLEDTVFRVLVIEIGNQREVYR